MDHDILLFKLEIMELEEFSLISLSPLSDWPQRIFLSPKAQGNGTNFFSRENISNTSVPRRSIVGPLLFLIYSHDLEQKINVEDLTHHTDDTSIIISNPSVSTISEKITETVNTIYSWCRENKLLLNVEKTAMLVRVNDTLVDEVNQIYFLGICLDNNGVFQYIHCIRGNIKSTLLYY